MKFCTKVYALYLPKLTYIQHNKYAGAFFTQKCCLGMKFCTKYTTKYLGMKLPARTRYFSRDQCYASSVSAVNERQGDQIGRILAYWAIVFFGLFFENYKRSPNVSATFIYCERYV
jgi:hypothetical protein